MNKKTLVAVYGTLKSDQANHGLLADSELIGSGTTPASYKLLEMGSFPGAIWGNHQLMVEIYEVNDKTLDRLDQLEGHPSFYERKLIQVKMDDAHGIGSEVVEAWMYTIAHLSSNYSHRPVCTDFDELNRINWSYKRDKHIW
jgi:gamma-glutamylcyclotransferase (GGCT)/AIG2-like uncharacterized protein YtfP